jgi:nucleotide-binding universal stress UspA family protein
MTDNEVNSTAGPHDTEETSRIIVGIDGSESSVKALREARRLADALGAPLEAVAVWQQGHSMYDFYQSRSGWTPEKDIEKLLQDAAEAAFGSDHPAHFTTTILQGTPTKALIRHSTGAEMLVLGSRGHGGFSGLLLGSVSSACVAHATCPVLIVHNKDQVQLDAEKSASNS